MRAVTFFFLFFLLIEIFICWFSSIKTMIQSIGVSALTLHHFVTDRWLIVIGVNCLITLSLFLFLVVLYSLSHIYRYSFEKDLPDEDAAIENVQLDTMSLRTIIRYITLLCVTWLDINVVRLLFDIILRIYSCSLII